MPLHDYKCQECGHVEEELHRGPGLAKELGVCPVCGGESKKIYSAGMRRHAEGTEIWSKAMGVNPDQIPQMKKLYPDHEYHPETGDLRIRGFQDQKRKARELGMEILG